MVVTAVASPSIKDDIASAMIGIPDIQTAMGRIREAIRISPCTRSESFSILTNNQIFLKLDNQQRTGAFKERGALNKLLTLTGEERAHGVNCRIRRKSRAGGGFTMRGGMASSANLYALANPAHKSFGYARLRSRSDSAWREL